MRVIVFLAMLFAAFTQNAVAQLWIGGLGDPVVDITFGYGSNPGQPVPSAQTTLSYSQGSCPKPGEYGVVNLTFSCFDNSWHTVSGDHTPADGGGYYMLINSESTKADFFIYTASGLCPKTKYEFGAWIKNALRPTACNNEGVAPNLTFTVETISGTVLSTYNTQNITSSEGPEWKQYGLVFETSATTTDVVLRIKNSAISGCGNVFALDDITVRPCGPLVNAKIASSGLNSMEVCEGGEGSFTLVSNYGADYANPVFQWQSLGDGLEWKDINGANSSNYLRPPGGTGSYTYRMVIAEAGSKCSITSNEVFINVLHKPFVQATNYVYGCLGGDVSLLASGANTYVWTGPNGYISTEQSPVLPTVQYSDAGLYKVVGTTHLGCKNSDSTILRVYPNATASSSQGLFICEGASTKLFAGGGVRYQWEPITGLSSDTIATPVASPLESTLYHVRVTNQFGCSDTANIKINVWNKTVADAGPDRKLRIGIPITLKGSAKGSDVTWFWTPASNLSTTGTLDPVCNPPQTTTYSLHVVSPHGCGTSTDDVLVKVYDKIVVPNAFSPNGDGINDTWFIDPLYLFEEAVVEVFNRYGQVIYRNRGYNVPWNGTSNGTPVPTGTYYYIIDLRVNKEPKLTGSVTILR
jgi:gliding motility-associated-like protein